MNPRTLATGGGLKPCAADDPSQQLLELSFPADQFEWNVDLQTGPIQLHYKMRYIGRMLTSAAYGHIGLTSPPQSAAQAGLFTGGEDD